MNFLPVIIGVLLFSMFSDKGGGKPERRLGQRHRHGKYTEHRRRNQLVQQAGRKGYGQNERRDGAYVQSRRGGAGWQVFRQSADERSRRKNT